MIDQTYLDTIQNGILDQANQSGTNYGLPQWIVYTALVLYIEGLKATIPHQTSCPSFTNKRTIMSYRIEIHFEGRLLLATDPKCIKKLGDLIDLFNLLSQKFPEQERYLLVHIIDTDKEGNKQILATHTTPSEANLWLQLHVPKWVKQPRHPAVNLLLLCIGTPNYYLYSKKFKNHAFRHFRTRAYSYCGCKSSGIWL